MKFVEKVVETTEIGTETDPIIKIVKEFKEVGIVTEPT